MSHKIYSNWYGLLLATVILNAYFAHAAEFNPIICISPGVSDPRLLEVEYLSDALVPCRTYYTKWDVREQIGSAQYTAGYCEGIVERVMESLADDGFLCQRVDDGDEGKSVYDRYKQIEPGL